MGNWAGAEAAAQRGWDATNPTRPLWAARFALFITQAAVELALDSLARRVPVDVPALAEQLTRRLEAARAALVSRDDELAPIVTVQLAHARALIATLTGATPDAWSRVAAGWEAVGDRWMAADARLRVAESSLAAGDAARAASALRAAHTTALDLASEPLLARVDAVSRRSRISVESIDAAHRNNRDAAGKPWLGIGYHFVVGNGQSMADGEVRSTFRWKQQLAGAHAGKREHNEQGIGVCLIGDFDQAAPTTRQVASLTALVKTLAARYSIPRERIYRHLDFQATLCPGRMFPWDQVRREVAASSGP